MAPQVYRLCTRHCRGHGQEQRQGIIAFRAQSKRGRYEEVDKDNGVLVPVPAFPNASRNLTSHTLAECKRPPQIHSSTFYTRQVPGRSSCSKVLCILEDGDSSSYVSVFDHPHGIFLCQIRISHVPAVCYLLSCTSEETCSIVSTPSQQEVSHYTPWRTLDV